MPLQHIFHGGTARHSIANDDQFGVGGDGVGAKAFASAMPAAAVIAHRWINTRIAARNLI